MKILIYLLLSITVNNMYGQANKNSISPLASFSPIWNEIAYLACNTAANETYLTKNEKEVIYIVNLVRKYPLTFCNTVLSKYPQTSGKEYLLTNEYYYKSLISNLTTLSPLPILTPDRLCFESALCHSSTSGKSDYVGHERITNKCTEKEYYRGECCAYGNEDPLEIVLQLLIDEDVPSFGHREILLGNYYKIGISIQPHTTYEFNAVLDLY